jgi:hypothetical protein
MNHTQQLMDYLYEEMTADERTSFEHLLAHDADLRNELEELRGTQGMLREWKDEVPAPLTLIPAGSPRILHRTSFAAGIAASFFVLTLVTLLAGGTFHKQENGFSLTLGTSVEPASIVPQNKKPEKIQEAAPPVQTIAPEPAKGLTAEDMKMILQLVEAHNEKNMQQLVAKLNASQEKQLEAALGLFAGYLGEQRKSDIRMISAELEKIRTTSDDKFYQTNQALGDLYESVQLAGR